MLSEITIRDFAIIDNLTLQFEPGFNVLTGETGAGKSIILDAVSLLMGGRAAQDEIRSGQPASLVEGIFVLREGPARERVNAILAQEELEGDSPDVLVLGREVRRGGRSLCRINGRTVPLNLLQAISAELVDIHGQSEHLSLLKPALHLDLLDRYAGLMADREAFARLVRQVEDVRTELRHLVEDESALQQRAEMLAYKVEEIRGAAFKPGEEEDLRDEARRLANAEQLAELRQEAYQALFGSAEGFPSGSDLASEAAGALSRLVKIDPGAADLAEMAEAVAIQIEELGRRLADYEEQVEFDPVRLQEAELRLDLLRMLKRKYACESIEELLEAADQAARDLQTIEHSGERIEELQKIEASLLTEIGKQGLRLSAARQEAARELGKAVETELADLRMQDAIFEIAIEQIDNPDGAPVGDYRVAFDQTGIDRVEFLIAPNLGEPPKPLARIASGGETSRIMLALKTVLSRADQMPTLIFDEIDSGIGGRIGAVVGQKLWGLSGEHQVLVVTHLPQLAGFADAHFKVDKQVEGQRTVVRVLGLGHEKRVDELTAMLGAEAESARNSAQEILAYVGRVKQHKAPSAG